MTPFARLAFLYRHGGARAVSRAIYNRLCPPAPRQRPQVLAALRGRSGLEIGGPTRLFQARGLFPVYPIAACIDNVNFSTRTTWERELREGGEFRFHPSRDPGRQLIREATALDDVGDGTYDFVLSSHCLEHVANPLRALQEWRRVTRAGGHLLLILPDPEHTFDHRRPVTPLTHLEADLAHDTPEDDPTHLAEVLALHDLGRDPGAGTAEAFQARVRRNAENRCVHHHVFDLALAEAALLRAGWTPLAAERVRPLHLCVFAQR